MDRHIVPAGVDTHVLCSMQEVVYEAARSLRGAMLVDYNVGAAMIDKPGTPVLSEGEPDQQAVSTVAGTTVTPSSRPTASTAACMVRPS